VFPPRDHGGEDRLDHPWVVTACLVKIPKYMAAVVGEGPGGIGEVVGNVGDASTRGIDLEIKALPLEGLELALSGMLLQAETEDDALVPDPTGGVPILVPSGSRIPGTSEESLSLRARYEFDVTDGITGFAGASYAYIGDARDNIVRQNEIPDYSVVAARIGITGSNWQVILFGENLTDEEIRLNREVIDDRLTGDTRWARGRPRTIGATLRFDW
jgi:iron complex outermembrane receptor protein